MAIKVNLIKNRHSISEAEYQRERGYFRMSVIGIVVVVVITLAVAIWQFVLTQQLNKVETEIASSTKDLQNLSQASAMQIYLKSRLKLITSFLDGRAVSRQALQKIFSVEIPGVTITGASFESDSVLKVQATATDVISLGKLVDYMSSKNDFFVQIVSSGISRSSDGGYQMDLLMTVPKS